MTTRAVRRQQVGERERERGLAQAVKQTGSRSGDEGMTHGGETTKPRAEDGETKGIQPAREREPRDSRAKPPFYGTHPTLILISGAGGRIRVTGPPHR